MLELPDGRILKESLVLLEFLDDSFALPVEPRYARVRHWVDGCLAHPAAQQVTKEEIVKVYYDYAKGAGNGALLPGRRVSSFTLEPGWQQRPWPPRNKYEHAATDSELGLEAPCAGAATPV